MKDLLETKKNLQDRIESLTSCIKELDKAIGCGLGFRDLSTMGVDTLKTCRSNIEKELDILKNELNHVSEDLYKVLIDKVRLLTSKANNIRSRMLEVESTGATEYASVTDSLEEELYDIQAMLEKYMVEISKIPDPKIFLEAVIAVCEGFPIKLKEEVVDENYILRHDMDPSITLAEIIIASAYAAYLGTLENDR